MAPQSGLHSFNFLGSSILAAVDEQVFSSMPGGSSNSKQTLLSPVCHHGRDGGRGPALTPRPL